MLASEQDKAERQSTVANVLEGKLLIYFLTRRVFDSQRFTATIAMASRSRTSGDNNIFRATFRLTQKNTEIASLETQSYCAWLDIQALEDEMIHWEGWSADATFSKSGFSGIRISGLVRRIPAASPLWQFYLGWLQNELNQDLDWTTMLSSVDLYTLRHRFGAFVKMARSDFSEMIGY
jgi:hypothetical protein